MKKTAGFIVPGRPGMTPSGRAEGKQENIFEIKPPPALR
jgi:hypothetical protein